MVAEYVRTGTLARRLWSASPAMSSAPATAVALKRRPAAILHGESERSSRAPRATTPRSDATASDPRRDTHSNPLSVRPGRTSWAFPPRGTRRCPESARTVHSVITVGARARGATRPTAAPEPRAACPRRSATATGSLASSRAGSGMRIWPPSTWAFVTSLSTRASQSFTPAGSTIRRAFRPRVFTKYRASVTIWPSRDTWLESRAKSIAWSTVSPCAYHSTPTSRLNGRAVYWYTASAGAPVSSRNSAGSSVDSSLRRPPSALRMSYFTWSGLATSMYPRSPCTPSGRTCPGLIVPPRALIGCSKVTRSVAPPSTGWCRDTITWLPSRRQSRCAFWPRTSMFPADAGTSMRHSLAGAPTTK